jgi:hypothetical protein
MVLAIVSTVSALLSGLFAGVAWWSWRKQFRMSLPYVEVFPEMGENCIFIHWSKCGPDHENWKTDSVRLKAKSGQLAHYRSWAKPDNGRAFVGNFDKAGAVDRPPQDPICIIDVTPGSKIRVDF